VPSWPDDPAAYLSPHFRRRELACRCCGKLVLDPLLLLSLEWLRMELGNVPVHVSRAYSCPAHNARVGGQPKSKHLIGQAADVLAMGITVEELLAAALRVPYFERGGIGVYPVKRFLHGDVREARARWYG